MEQYNPWWKNETDPKYQDWKDSNVAWVPKFLEKISLKPFSLHFLSGPRQVGKTTAIKILIHDLVKDRDPFSVFYYPCNEVMDHRELGKILDDYLNARDARGITGSVIVLDEITFVKEWWRAVKDRIDQGLLKKDVLIVTGSASIDLLKHKEMFPGRRGNGKDMVLNPLDFSSYAKMLGGMDLKSGGILDLDANAKANAVFDTTLKGLFERYLETGGFPKSIQDMKRYGHVTEESLQTYLDWLKGDWAKAGCSDGYMKEILSYLMLAKGTTVSWNTAGQRSGSISPNTVRSYVETLGGIHALLTLNYLSAQGRVEYRKNKKLHFKDPFIFKVLTRFTGVPALRDRVVEATVASHLSRVAPVYFWQGRTEVDVVCVVGQEQVGVEVTTGLKKWSAPHHIKKAILLDKGSVHLYLSALDTDKGL
jgi:hypothetical protein